MNNLLQKRFERLLSKARYYGWDIYGPWAQDDDTAYLNFVMWYTEQMYGCEEVDTSDTLLIRVDKKKGISPDNLIVQIKSTAVEAGVPFPMSDQLAANIRRFAKEFNRYSRTYIGKVYGLSASTIWNLCVGQTHQGADYYELPLVYNWNDLNTMVKKYKKLFGQDKVIYVNNRTGEVIVKDPINTSSFTLNRKKKQQKLSQAM